MRDGIQQILGGYDKHVDTWEVEAGVHQKGYSSRVVLNLPSLISWKYIYNIQVYMYIRVLSIYTLK